MELVTKTERTLVYKEDAGAGRWGLPRTDASLSAVAYWTTSREEMIDTAVQSGRVGASSPPRWGESLMSTFGANRETALVVAAVRGSRKTARPFCYTAGANPDLPTLMMEGRTSAIGDVCGGHTPASRGDCRLRGHDGLVDAYSPP